MRRLGPLTAYDRANGVYANDDRIQVLFDGAWVDSRVMSSIGMEYEVELPGIRKAWAKPEQMRFVSVAPPKVAARDRPAPAGMVSCAGKTEGRYAMSNGMPYAVTFRSGKVVIPEMGEQRSEGQCLTGNGKIILRLDGEDQDMEIEINDEGTPQTPLGEMKKRAR